MKLTKELKYLNYPNEMIDKTLRYMQHGYNSETWTKVKQHYEKQQYKYPLFLAAYYL